MITQTAQTFSATIYIAGSVSVAKQVCRRFCLEFGDCVTLHGTSYIYTGGEEHGVAVGFINYPRFPRSAAEISERAAILAERLREALCQHSYSIVTPTETNWVSYRAERLREVDSGTDNACWVVCNKVDEGSIAFVPSAAPVPSKQSELLEAAKEVAIAMSVYVPSAVAVQHSSVEWKRIYEAYHRLRTAIHNYEQGGGG